MSDTRITTAEMRKPIPISQPENNPSAVEHAPHAAKLGDVIDVSQQQIDAGPAGLRDAGMQVLDGARAAGQLFEKLSGRSLLDEPVQEAPRLDMLRTGLDYAIKNLASIRPVTITNSAAVNSNNIEHLHNAARQLKTAQHLYSQQQSTTGERVARSLVGAGAYFPDKPVPEDLSEPSPWTPGGDFDMFWTMQQQIGQINTNYIKTYQYMMGGFKPPDGSSRPSDNPNLQVDITPEGGYTQFFTDLTKYMGEKTKYLTASSDTGKIKFKFTEFKQYFEENMKKYTTKPPATNIIITDSEGKQKTQYLYPLTAFDYYPDTTPEQQKELLTSWTTNLGAGFRLKDIGRGVQIWIDTTIVQDMLASITNSFATQGSDINMPQQMYSSWETAWNGNQNTVSTIMQRLGDLYSSANRTFDNLTKIMTSAYQSCVDCAKDFLKV